MIGGEKMVVMMKHVEVVLCELSVCGIGMEEVNIGFLNGWIWKFGLHGEEMVKRKVIRFLDG